MYFLNWTASSSADYISTPTLTFCTWVYLTGTTGYATILSYNREQYTSIRVTGTSIAYGNDTIHWSSVNPPNVLLVTYSYPLKNAGWHHLTFVKDASLNYSIFLDGKKVATSQDSYANYTQYTQLRILDIGSDGFQGNSFFYGKLDDYLVCTDVLFTNDFSLPTKSVKAMFPNANWVVDLSTDGRKTNTDTDILKVY